MSGSASSWAQRPSRFDVAEEDTHVLPKLDSSDVSEKMNRMDQNGDMMQDNHDSRIVGNQDGEIAGNDDGEVKQLDDAIPNRFEAMKAVGNSISNYRIEIISMYFCNDETVSFVFVFAEKFFFF